ncbi:unnamed protein product [Leptosia nina]|uniref:A-kinase anchor protein 17A n=1 Tax=Leptosia nina TaxID=320188 RepID=A0AAV1J016_9NEOP
MSIQVCRDTSDAVALYLPQRLYLKPFAKLNISVQLPTHKVHGKSISNWELMEKLRKMIQPDGFSMLKVSKHSSEVIRFEAELENRAKLERVISRLEDRVVQLNDFPEPLKVCVSEAKSDFPSRHSWDSFFRDATDMDEMKPGERPDTIHITNMPIRWFVHDQDRNEDSPPSEKLFKKVFEKFGEVRQVDVPASDPFRMQMKDSMRGITTPPQDSALYFEGYVQYSAYVSFVRCMDTLRGKKILRKNDDLAEWCTIHVDFDKSKHMTDAAVKRRAIVRERLSSRQRDKEEEERLEKERKDKIEAKERQRFERNEKDKLERMREREERRKKKQLAKLMEREDVDFNKKVSDEKKKLLKVQKKLQAIRLIEELFKRIELRPELQRNGAKSERYYHASERAARSRIVDKFKRQQEKLLDEQQELLRHAKDGRIIIRSALETKKPRRDSSISSISSEDLDKKRVKTERLTTPERENEYKNAVAGLYPNPYGYGYPFVPPPGYPFPQSVGLGDVVGAAAERGCRTSRDHMRHSNTTSTLKGLLKWRVAMSTTTVNGHDHDHDRDHGLGGALIHDRGHGRDAVRTHDHGLGRAVDVLEVAEQEAGVDARVLEVGVPDLIVPVRNRGVPDHIHGAGPKPSPNPSIVVQLPRKMEALIGHCDLLTELGGLRVGPCLRMWNKYPKLGYILGKEEKR